MCNIRAQSVIINLSISFVHHTFTIFYVPTIKIEKRQFKYKCICNNFIWGYYLTHMKFDRLFYIVKLECSFFPVATTLYSITQRFHLKQTNKQNLQRPLVKKILWKSQVIATTVSVSIQRICNRRSEIHEQSYIYKEELKIMSVKYKQNMSGFQGRSENF